MLNIFIFSSWRSPKEADAKRQKLDKHSPGWRNLKYENGQPMYATDGTMLDQKGSRSIFDDMDE